MAAEITVDGIVGQLTPPVDAMVSCQTSAGSFDDTTVDEVGCFALRSPGHGAMRLHVELGERALATEWVNLA